METIFCNACAQEMSKEADACPKCGHPNASKVAVYSVQKSRIVAGVLALLLGGLGIHKFYLNKTGLGVAYLLLCWTLVPALIAFVEAIIYFLQDDKTFALKQGLATR